MQIVSISWKQLGDSEDTAVFHLHGRAVTLIE